MKGEQLLRKWDERVGAVGKHLAGLYSSPTYTTAMSALENRFYAAETHEFLKSVHDRIQTVLADYALLTEMMDAAREVWARGPGLVGSFFPGSDSRDEMLTQILERPSILISPAGPISLVEPEPAKKPVRPDWLWQTLCKEVEALEVALQKLESNQVKLVEIHGELQSKLKAIETEAGSELFLDAEQVELLEGAKAMHERLGTNLQVWGRNPISDGVWKELEEMRLQMTSWNAEWRAMRAARVFVEERLDKGDDRLIELEQRWRQLKKELEEGRIRDGDAKVLLLPRLAALAQLSSWLMKLKDSAGKRRFTWRCLRKALSVWTVRGDEFEKMLKLAEQKIREREEERNELRGLFEALRVKAGTHGRISEGSPIWELNRRLEGIFGKPVVDLREVRVLVKAYREAVC